MLLAAEGVMMLSRQSVLGSSAHKSSKLTGHWILMLLAVTSAVLGSCIVDTDIDSLGWLHFLETLEQFF